MAVTALNPYGLYPAAPRPSACILQARPARPVMVKNPDGSITQHYMPPQYQAGPSTAVNVVYTCLVDYTHEHSEIRTILVWKPGHSGGWSTQTGGSFGWCVHRGWSFGTNLGIPIGWHLAPQVLLCQPWFAPRPCRRWHHRSIPVRRHRSRQ